MAKLKTALIGCGGIANRHMTVISSLGDKMEMVAFCDIAEDRAEAFADRYKAPNAEIFTDFAEMYENVDLDLVYICLPPFAHSNEVDLAAEKGVHIFIEKPIAIDMKTANRMAKAVRKHGVKSQVGFMFRFGEAIETVKAMLDSGEAGPVGLMMARYMCNSLHAPWWRDRSKSGGQVVEQIIHLFDLTRYLLGEAESAFCWMNNIFHTETEGYTAEDVSATSLKFKSGAVATVSGTNGAIPGQWLSQYELITQNLTVRFSDANNATLHHTDMGWRKTTTISSEKDIYLAETLDLITAIEEDKDTRIPMSEGAKTLELVLAVRESADAGQPVKIK